MKLLPYVATCLLWFTLSTLASSQQPNSKNKALNNNIKGLTLQTPPNQTKLTVKNNLPQRTKQQYNDDLKGTIRVIKSLKTNTKKNKNN